MENKCKRVETDKNHRSRDRGDVSRKNAQHEIELQKHPPDRGDLKRTLPRATRPDDKPKLVKTHKKEEHKRELVSHSTNTYQETETPKRVEKPEKKAETEGKEYRDRVRDRYTIRPKCNLRVDSKKDEHVKIIQDDLSPKTQRDKSKDSKETKSEKSAKDPSTMKRKPIIKTITSKNDAVRVYKAVTFVDQNNTKPLQIKIPNGNVIKKPRSRIPKLTERSRIPTSPSKIALAKPVVKQKKKVIKAKQDTRVHCLPSSEVSAAKIVSPPTEVAKWAPTSTNKHTMPYYEAWVNTTLAAISKCSKKDKQFLEKQNVLQTFKRQLMQRQMSPELVYENLADETYTGKITVRQR